MVYIKTYILEHFYKMTNDLGTTSEHKRWALLPLAAEKNIYIVGSLLSAVNLTVSRQPVPASSGKRSLKSRYFDTYLRTVPPLVPTPPSEALISPRLVPRRN